MRAIELFEIELVSQSPDYLKDIEIKNIDFTSNQLDLFKEIPSLDPKLPNHLNMKIIGNMNGMRIVRHYVSDATRMKLPPTA